MKKPLPALIALAVAVGLGVWYYLAQHRATPPPTPPKLQQAEPPPPIPAIEHPVPQDTEQPAHAAALPALSNSDKAIHEALGELIGADAVKNYLMPEDLIRRVVATVDNLPRRKVPVEKRPVVAVSGAFVAQGSNEQATLDARNYARYAPMVDVIRKLDMQRLAKLYLHFYPLFQSAYQDLGYPDGYFNDRLIAVIDVLLASPQPTGQIELVRPNVMYQFANPELEALPAGQKLLIRIGPDNAAVIKGKLTELRAALTAGPKKH